MRKAADRTDASVKYPEHGVYVSLPLWRREVTENQSTYVPAIVVGALEQNWLREAIENVVTGIAEVKAAL